MSRPASSAGRITRAVRSARAARKSSSSASGSSASSGSASSSRIRSAASVPPGSRISSVSGPSASASSFACVLFPEPSIPSSETNTSIPSGGPYAGYDHIKRTEAGCLFGRGLGAFAAAGGGVGFARDLRLLLRRRLVLVAFRQRLLRHRFFGRFRRFAFGPFPLHLLHRLAVVVEAEVPGPAAERLDLQPRRLAADRAAFLEFEDVAALGQREG